MEPSLAKQVYAVYFRLRVIVYVVNICPDISPWLRGLFLRRLFRGNGAR
jgi:hypothetical protein